LNSFTDYSQPTEEEEEDSEVGNTGIATVPNVVRLQKLKDGRLVVEAEDFEQGITFKESWSAKRINKFMNHYFSTALEYQKKHHRDDLGKGQFHWIPCTAESKKLIKFTKKDEINGKDLANLKTGKAKKIREQTLYFGLLFLGPVASLLTVISPGSSSFLG
jgi:hypothetical protein